ncbi:hypothetical protein TWF730_002682 [Orbilia blumenaviensis]|uniref:Uncharacterized protein n=1 Tax=Orbilia blumenaviensis TaxID=1796055 RepID=A0AAV9U7I3_9PEZI
MLVGCSEDVAPRRLADPEMHTICRVNADLGDIPLSQFQKTQSLLTGMVFYKADLKLQATFASEVLTWKVLCGGKERGSTTVTYDE